MLWFLKFDTGKCGSTVKLLEGPKTPSLTPLYDQEYFHMFIELDHDHELLTVTTEQFILNREYMEIEFSLTVDNKVCFMDNKKKHYVYTGSLKDSQDLWHKCQALWHQSRKCHCSPLSQTSGNTGNQEQTDGHSLSTKSSSVWWKTVPPSIHVSPYHWDVRHVFYLPGECQDLPN